MKKTKPHGRCSLSEVYGPYVKSHLIPRALTVLSRDGGKRIETGIGAGFKLRPDSWYDPALCTRAGEDILEEIDTAGIEDLRRLRLVWSGWDDHQFELQLLPTDRGTVDLRLLNIENSARLRLFFISLLWRAAASKLPEFADVNLSEEILKDLRNRIKNKDVGDPRDYPIQLFQLITRGPPHNRTPMLERKHIVQDDGTLAGEIEYVRFYFDGLVSHIHLAQKSKLSESYLNTCLGFAEFTPVFGHKYLNSRTNENIREMVVTVLKERVTCSLPKSPIWHAISEMWPRDAPGVELMATVNGIARSNFFDEW